jgi:hypothetical protein
MIRIGSILINPDEVSSIHLDLTSSSVHRDRGAQIIQVIYKNGVVKNFLDREIGLSYDEFIKLFLENQEKAESDRIFRAIATLKSLNNG